VTSRGIPGLATSAPARDTILTAREVAAWLKINPRQVQRLGIPCVDLGRKTRRYLAEDVLDWLETYRRPPGPRASLTEPKRG